MMFMIERIRLGNTFKCPSCRTRVNIDEISYVSESAGNQEYAHINVKVWLSSFLYYLIFNSFIVVIITLQGSWGTKIEAVVREILLLREAEPTVKVLLFSQWNEVLEIVSRALQENSIRFARVHGKRSIEVCSNNNITIVMS